MAKKKPTPGRPAIVDGRPVPEIVLALKQARKAQRAIDAICSDPWWQQVGITPPPARIDGKFVRHFHHVLIDHDLDPHKYLDFVAALKALKRAVAASRPAVVENVTTSRADFAACWIRDRQADGTYDPNHYWPLLIADYQRSHPEDCKPNLDRRDFLRAKQYRDRQG